MPNIINETRLIHSHGYVDDGVYHELGATENIPAHILNKIAKEFGLAPPYEDYLLQRDPTRDIGEERLQTIRDVKADNFGAKYTIKPNSDYRLHRANWAAKRNEIRFNSNLSDSQPPG